MLDGEPVSVDRVIESLRRTMTIDSDICPEIRIKKDYEANEAPKHAVAFQLALKRHNLLLIQEPAREGP